MKISEVCSDITMCKELLNKLEKAVQSGKLTPTTAHAIIVKVNDYLDILEVELDNQ